MAKQNWGTSLVKKLKQDGWIEVNGLILPQKRAQDKLLSQNHINRPKENKSRLNRLKISGWIDDERNIRNKEKQKDVFIQLVKQELGLIVWPEFFFSTERQFRIDYAIPVDQNGNPVKIALEQEGGIWMKGNSGHSSGKGIKRDMDKNNLLLSSGWSLIRRQPSEMLTTETLDLIKKIIENFQK